jgi:biotin-dependent carboxylase-like uncharacterized protein
MNTPDLAVVEVIDPGLLSTVQDLGRAGSGALGVSPSGAVDWFAALAANRLAGNDDDAPLIETTLTGIALEAREDVTVAVTGADATVSIGGTRRARWRSWRARAGDRIIVGPAVRGARSYVAFGGGIVETARILGSASTDVGGGFGGRVLAKGDRLIVAALDRGFDVEYPQGPPSIAEPVTLRAMVGPQAALLGADIVDSLFAREFRAGARSGRQALRLEGASIASRAATEAVSTGVCAGCVQVTGEGQPVVMLAEHQTTGGYPVALCVVWADLPRAAQTKPGDAVRFARTDAGGARAALYESVAMLRSLRRVAEASAASVESQLSRGFFEGAGS